ncbi:MULTISPECIES: DKNYY domain-containing protein [Paracoccus]|uniref:DKNYY domain-containing protein n=1 Tax=Paracoccus TaxID=265 RepID=UPI000225F3E2|nr:MULTISPECIES: DKNYY domain-containing protein [Paracoccus]
MTESIPELQPYPIDADVEGLPYCLGPDGNIAMRDGSRMGYDSLKLRKGFVQYENGFSKDEKAVYSWGRRIMGANPATFRVLSRAFVTDGNHVWNHIGKVKDADPTTFAACDSGEGNHWGTGYGKDANSVFFSPGDLRARRVVKADTRTFRSCGDTCLVGYDDYFTFAQGSSIPKAKRKGWRYLSYSYSRDEKAIFYLNSRVEGADLESFEVVPVFSSHKIGPAPLARDRNHYYWCDEIIDNDEFGAKFWIRYAVVSDPDDMPPIARKLGWELENPIVGRK